MNQTQPEQIIPLSREWFRREVLELAPELLGRLLVRRFAGGELVVGRIVETEAYREDDPASHSHRGRTPRTAAMFEDGGAAYVYLIYGMYHCFNVVADRAGVGSAVLIRAVEPLHGLAAMWRNRFGERGPTNGPPAGKTTADPHGDCARRSPALRAALTNGPGKLAQSFAITIAAHNGAALYHGAADAELTIAERVVTGEGAERGERHEFAATPPRRTARTPRIGIRAAADRHWRFADPESYALSRRPGQ